MKDLIGVQVGQCLGHIQGDVDLNVEGKGGEGCLVIPESWSNTHPLVPLGEPAAQTHDHDRFLGIACCWGASFHSGTGIPAQSVPQCDEKQGPWWRRG